MARPLQDVVSGRENVLWSGKNGRRIPVSGQAAVFAGGTGAARRRATPSSFVTVGDFERSVLLAVAAAADHADRDGAETQPEEGDGRRLGIGAAAASTPLKKIS
jgi:hypothetical protein